VRGDVATVRRHLTALQRAPEARAVYISLSRAAVKFLPVKHKTGLATALNRANQDEGASKP